MADMPTVEALTTARVAYLESQAKVGEAFVVANVTGDVDDYRRAEELNHTHRQRCEDWLRELLGIGDTDED